MYIFFFISNLLFSWFFLISLIVDFYSHKFMVIDFRFRYRIRSSKIFFLSLEFFWSLLNPPLNLWTLTFIYFHLLSLIIFGMDLKLFQEPERLVLWNAWRMFSVVAATVWLIWIYKAPTMRTQHPKNLAEAPRKLLTMCQQAIIKNAWTMSRQAEAGYPETDWKWPFLWPAAEQEATCRRARGSSWYWTIIFSDDFFSTSAPRKEESWLRYLCNK